MTENKQDKGDDSSVRVGLRVRPQLAKEKIDMCQVCTSVTPGEPQVVLGKDKAFTFDYVFDLDSEQTSIYNSCGHMLIEGCFEGYNATIFAYGQTGSGKTYSMGTGFDINQMPEEVGIIPRAIEHLFRGIDARKEQARQNSEPPPDFKIQAQFMELYNEEINDLLDTTRDPSDKGRKSHIKIHEDAAGGIYCVGMTTRAVNSMQDTMQCLKMGALTRTTASTNMNAQSSRSHAIFTLIMRQQRLIKDEGEDEDGSKDEEEGKDRDTSEVLNEFETLTAKFHFVDLAGSERLKRTGATGDRAKEGISINCGLLALGNVISALGDKAKKGSHVPYRDSKLTRLLQDSLGGNSRTVMIACVSPSDRDFMETLNTLKYANRARNIKNRVTVNQDKTSKQLTALRTEVQDLQMELMEYKSGKRMVDAEGVEGFNDMFHENTMLQTENDNLRQRIKAMHATVEALKVRNTDLIAMKEAMNISNMEEGAAEIEVKKLIEGYLKETEDLNAKLIESEALMETVKRQAASRTTPSRISMTPMSASMTTSMMSNFDFAVLPEENGREDILTAAKKDLEALMKRKKRARKRSQSSDKENVSDDEHEDDAENGDLDKDIDAVDEDEDEGHVEGEDENEDEDEDEDADAATESDEDDDDDDDYTGSCDQDKLHEDLADLTCEISIKEKLIEELEGNQKKMHSMRIHYEEKLVSLQTKIRSTEMERDKVLASIGEKEIHTDDKVKKVRDEYEKKLHDMVSDLKKLQAAKKEHAKLIRNNSHYEKQLKTLQRDMGDMKKTKVKLMQQIKDDSTKNRQVEMRKNKEIAQLKKEQLKKEHMIRSLEVNQKHKDQVLKRKQEEVEALRKKQQRPMSAKVAGRVAKYDKPPTVARNPLPSQRRTKKQVFNAKSAKSKWDALEKSVSSVIVKKQTLSHMEKDMERWLRQRESLSKKIDKFARKQDKCLALNDDPELLKDLRDQTDTLRDNIAYVQENINECQSNIMQIEESKVDEKDPNCAFEKVSLEEAKYLLEHFVTLAINKGLLASQKESESKELQAKLHQERMDSTFQHDMLQYLIQDKVDIEIDDSLMMRDRDDSDSDSSSSDANSPIDSMLDNQVQPIQSPTGGGGVSGGGGIGAVPALPPGGMASLLLSTPLAPQTSLDSVNTSSSSVAGRRDKARRKTTTPADLLFACGLGSPGGGESHSSPISPIVALRPVREKPEEEEKEKLTSPLTMEAQAPDLMADVVLMPPPKSAPPRVRQNGPVPRSDINGPGRPEPSPSMGRKNPEPSPNMGRKNPEPSPNMGRKNPEASPSMSRKNPPLPSPSVTRKSFEITTMLTATSKNPEPSPSSSSTSGPSKRNPEPSPSMTRKNPPGGSTVSKPLDSSSPTMKRKVMMSSNSSGSGSLSRQSSVSDTTELTPPTSPTATRRNRSNNVFSRLTSQTQPASPHPSRGVIHSAGLSRPLRSSPLVHSHTAVGHSKAVLSVFATEDLMFSSSKDRTAKVWDLPTGEEILTLDGHPNNVGCVRYSEETSLAYTVSTYFIKVWDPREGNKCIKTLTSAGLTNDGPISISTSSRQVTCPPGETNINSVELNSTGSVLYSAAGSTVRIWDLRTFKSVGKLSGGHQAAVMVLAVDDTDTADGNICVVTGSKDHYIKVFEVMEDSVGVLCPKYNLEPPHYDGIQSLCLMGDLLFSGSRDNCIKKWDLAENELKHSINNAHKDWICGLAFMPGGNCLLSGCRGGFLKLWHIDNCSKLGEVKAHSSPINSITTNSKMIFTASNEYGVKFWNPDWESMPASALLTEEEEEYYV